MVDISYKNTLKKTIIEVDSEYYQKIFAKVREKSDNDKIAFTPPLFDEYVIRIVEPKGNRNYYYDDLLRQQETFRLMSESERQKCLTAYLKQFRIEEDAIETIYVKYTSATELYAIYFERLRHKKLHWVRIIYQHDVGMYTISYDTDRKFSNLSEDELSQLGQIMIQRIATVSNYMQNRGDFIEYEKIEVGKLEKVEPTSSTVTDKAQPNAGYRQKIKLKSKVKKYIISEETERQRKAYRKITPCWYVRGYYQHFGKQKILKYIPPRINYRADEKLKAQQGKKRKPKSREYEIIDNNEQNKKGTP